MMKPSFSMEKFNSSFFLYKIIIFNDTGFLRVFQRNDKNENTTSIYEDFDKHLNFTLFSIIQQHHSGLHALTEINV